MPVIAPVIAPVDGQRQRGFMTKYDCLKKRVFSK